MTEGGGYFAAAAGCLHPTAAAAATWDPATVHGRLVVGVLARAVEAAAPGPTWRCAHLTVDLTRPTRRAPLAAGAEIVRAGSRVASVDAEVRVGDEVTARARAVLLAPSEPAVGEVWTTPPWGAPPPEEVAPVSADQRRLLPWDARPVHGPDLVTDARKAVWVHDPVPLVVGEELSPLVALATVADAVNPLANSGTRGLRHINVDLSLQVVRAPVGRWFGFDVSGHLAADGIAAGTCTVHDVAGPVGTASTTALAMRRPARHHRRARGAAAGARAADGR